VNQQNNATAIHSFSTESLLELTFQHVPGVRL
jgi:hypothetical protein